MLIFVEGANRRCLHFCFLVVNALNLFLVQVPSTWTESVADPENFGGGGFEAQNLKNSDVFTKIESDFSAEIGNSNVFFAQIQVVSKKKKKKKKGLHQN